MSCGGPVGGTLDCHMQRYNHMVNQQLQQIQHQQGANNGNWPTGAQVHSGASNGTSPLAFPSGNALLPGHIAWTNTNDPTSWTTKPLENAGIKVGEIIGWRIWMIKGDYLAAYSAGHIWAPGENMEGNVPDYGYEGIWSFKKKGDAIKKLLENLSPHAFGSIKMWGEVVEHAIGYRAQFAKVNSIDNVQPSNNKLLQTLRENYGLCQQLSLTQKQQAYPTPKEVPLTASQKLLNLLQLKPMTG
jgi:hypothetical protein